MRSVEEYLAVNHTIPGWFETADFELFVRILHGQEACEVHGDLLEVGVFHGRSAILLGYFASGLDRLHLCDTFGTGPDVLSGENRAENVRWYDGLTEQKFLDAFARFHQHQPVMHVRPSVELRQLLDRGSFRFIHLDGSHTESVVREDLALACELLNDNGVLVLDDYRSAHSPGVAAATWAAVASGQLRPIALTETKFYGATSDHAAEQLRRLIGTEPPLSLALVEEEIRGHVVRLFIPSAWDAPDSLPTASSPPDARGSREIWQRQLVGAELRAETRRFDREDCRRFGF